MLNPDVDNYTKNQNHWKILRKNEKKNTKLLKTKRLMKPKY